MTEVRASDRLRWLRRTARRWILAVVLLLVACLTLTGWSFGLFSASSTNAHNVVSAGHMSQTNSADNAAIMSASNLVPGDVVTGTVTIKNVGGAYGDFTLHATDVEDVPGPNGGKLSTRLRLKLFENGRALPIYDGLMVRLDESLGTWDPNEERSYEFVVRFPQSGDAADNAVQLSAVMVTFEWRAVQTH